MTLLRPVLFVTAGTLWRLPVYRTNVCFADRTQLREQYGDREESFLAESPFREGKQCSRPRLLHLIGEERGQALELVNGSIDQGRGRGSVRHDGEKCTVDAGCKFIQSRLTAQAPPASRYISQLVQLSVLARPVLAFAVNHFSRCDP